MEKRKLLSWCISLGILAALGWFFREELDFLQEGLRRLRHAELGPVLLVTVFSFGGVAAMSQVMRLLLAAGDNRVPLRETFAISMASNAWSTTLPAGPAFAAVLTFQVQRRWGASVALCSYFLFISALVSSMWLALIGIAGVFFLKVDMALGSLLATVALMVVAMAVIFWMTKHPAEVSRWLGGRSFRGARRLAAEMQHFHGIHLSRWAFSRVATWSLLHRLLDLLALWASVWAVTGQPPLFHAAENHTTIAGVALAYLTAKLAGSAQVTPAGLGTVEAAIITPLVATGLTAVDATSTAVIYRLISFALVTIIGWIIYFAHYARQGLTYQALNRKD
ncbi:lysylphosphatidylglycerol synthase transmembrane domain-containing protein [Corynebacterium lizhenjunii]|uniref:lysylphosphatidylglycerol synthase transmembrane domain-containing protein n=1 Tax=Corynebacterium lizhenjunii TaxID=2709394 RepID=UPI0013EC5646|nr:YbhN family protein [Corynebacterium lizhenjunii]